jgi:hypothetical protein
VGASDRAPDVGFATRREPVVDPKLRYIVAGICHATDECAIAE